ncbi:D-lactate ferricytochrome c oxidoreductase [Tilletia horrida]|uniref:Protein PBDC1 homolog n=1 Tax=Tilletia horrida TaxID=155126 RepID=A0AAN6G697_9BASI|nr:D-lactate ferricytochrome c oxidoreductase [Tilletia horrida]KAK0531769.1 D-lactate ferricytochrome c oxidoreductase [Tilletia horrida]KAK0534729.1 D-lactate ferricytochrome c oxidoreductase [Tilletia horrida]KAK0554022.1 D-lactate ferricytochrome c oxidoreductase [Tilletia horrida]
MAATAQPFDPNTAQNLPEIEKQMAVKCVEHAQVYWNLLEKLKPTDLKLTKLDDEIYADFEATFPEYSEATNTKAVLKLDEEAMKSPEGKERWRNFMMKYDGKVTDFNFGTLIRTDASDEYTQFNTTFVMRLQFYVFEIARNRRGFNNWVYEKAQKEKAKEEARKAKGKK